MDNAATPPPSHKPVHRIGASGTHAETEPPGGAGELTARGARDFPFVAVGIAFGSGLALGALGYALLRPRPATLKDRLDEVAIGRKLHRLLDRVL